MAATVPPTTPSAAAVPLPELLFGPNAYIHAATSLFLTAVLAAMAYRHFVILPKRRREHSRYIDAVFPKDYDVIIIGASIAGPALAKQLYHQGRRVLVVERDLKRPDRIVGELLQPGGIEMLQQMGIAHCATSVGSLCTGYVSRFEGEWVQLPFPGNRTSVSFHFGDFVMNLRQEIMNLAAACGGFNGGIGRDWREDKNTWFRAGTPPLGHQTAAAAAAGAAGHRGCIHVVEGTVTGVVFDDEADGKRPPVNGSHTKTGWGRRVVGVRFETKQPQQQGASETQLPTSVKHVCSSHLVVFCDGHGSSLRFEPPTYIHSHFVGVILKDVTLPFESRGHVLLAEHGPVLAYRLDPHEVRILVDYHNSAALPPADELKRWLLSSIAPQMPTEEMKKAFIDAVHAPRGVRSMPHHQFKPAFPIHYGYVGIGDHANQRHPLTGGGMTCALRDAYYLAEALKDISDFSVRIGSRGSVLDPTRDAILSYLRNRAFFTSTINILSWALHGVFVGPNAMRKACFSYFEVGGDCVAVPMRLLSGLDSSVATLLFRYVHVMIHGASIIIAGAPGKRSVSQVAQFFVNPMKWVEAVALLVHAVRIFAPLVYLELFPFGRFFDPLWRLF